MGLTMDTSGMDFPDLTARIPAALEKGADIILADALEKVPKESGDLAASGHIATDRGGDDTIGIEFSSVYAHWIHEHLGFKHPHGGQAKFLESAMVEKADEALKAMGDELL